MLEKRFISKLKKVPQVIIYGAGMVGGLVYKRLEAKGLADRIACFAVTEKAGRGSYMGIPVYEIGGAVEKYGSAAVVVATLPGSHEEMGARLRGLSRKDVIYTKPALYRSLCGNYIREFREARGDTEGPVDVALMASDNNSASGAFLCLADLACELQRQGLRPAVILPEYGDGERILAEKGVAYTYVESEDWCVPVAGKDAAKGKRMHKNRRAVGMLREYFRRHGVKLVHNNTVYTYVGAVAAYEEKLPVVWHVREDIRDQGRRFADAGKAAGLINRSDRILAVSGYMAGAVKGIDGRKVRVIYDGVDAGRFYCRKKILRGGPRPVITMAGAVTERKGQEDLLGAVCILKEKYGADFTVRFLGKEDGAYTGRLKDIVRRHRLEGTVEFLGKRDNVEDYFREADIAIVCSRAEPFGRVTVEALLAGCLVIGADSGATPELIRNGENGLLYRPGDPWDLAERIRQALEKPEDSAKMAEAGQERARNVYTKERNAREILRVYKEILGQD